MSALITCLGLESSCDDTAASVVLANESQSQILSSIVVGQTNMHSAFGGVVPEIAARAHTERLDHCVEQALTDADKTLNEVDLIAVTSGPGLIGGVVAGVMCAKGLAAASDKPIIGVNHLAGHALTPRLTDNLVYPYLLLLVSGGHCQFLVVKDAVTFERLGGTIDDAPGEAFDKTARILGLPQPGGPSVETAARSGDPTRFKLPRPLLDRPGVDLSFSGLKTALIKARDSVLSVDGTLAQQDVFDLSASFQAAVTDTLIEKSKRAIDVYLGMKPKRPAIAVSGGVAANQKLRSALLSLSQVENIEFVAPPLNLCTDNAAMIAYAGILQHLAGCTDDMSLSARPRWPLDKSQTPMLGSGKKGPKA